ncbi:MAG TPA: hypothetical protein VGM51_05710 [Armatimonadota bacterium]|jgi:hypothetical protein
MIDDEETQGESRQTVTDRRAFLRRAGGLMAAGLGAYATGLPRALAAVTMAKPASSANVVTIPQQRRANLETLSLDAFARHLNTHFSFQTGDGVVETVLVEAKDLLGGGPGHEVIRDCFSVLFRGSLSRPLPQGMYPTRHRTLGAFDLFIVPVRADARYLYYEAVFNHLRERVDPSRL